MFENLTEANHILYACKFYDNPQCLDIEEFYIDMNRFKYVKRLLNKYKNQGELRERLILNHLVIIYNMFGPIAGTRLLFLKLKGYEPYIKPFIVFLGNMPEVVRGIDGADIISSNIGMDPLIIDRLRKI